MRRPLIAGNWKLHGSLESISVLLSGIIRQLSSVTAAELVVCPPFAYLGHVRQLIHGADISLGAQDCSDQESGAYTGEVAATMIKEFGCRYVIVGHSERRHLYHEGNEVIATKFVRVKESGLIPVLCVGETLQERKDGYTESIIEKQMDAVLERLDIEAFRDAVIAYEPVWAIGTGHVATPSTAQEIHRFIRDKLHALNRDIATNIRIVYGGSMKADNAGKLLREDDIDGGLIGGAALKAEDFIAIAVAAN